MEDNLTSTDPLSYTTNGSRVDQGARSERLLPLNVRTPTPQLPVELRIINIDRQTGKQFIIKISSEDNRRRGVTITFLHGCSNEADHSAVGVGKSFPTHACIL